jgi:hypothetical protein
VAKAISAAMHLIKVDWEIDKTVEFLSSLFVMLLSELNRENTNDEDIHESELRLEETRLNGLTVEEINHEDIKQRADAIVQQIMSSVLNMPAGLPKPPIIPPAPPHSCCDVDTPADLSCMAPDNLPPELQVILEGGPQIPIDEDYEDEDKDEDEEGPDCVPDTDSHPVPFAGEESYLPSVYPED